MPLYDDTAATAAQSALTQLPIGVDWGMVNQSVLTLAETEAQRFAAQATETSRAQTSQVIANWIETGGTMADLIERVSHVWEGPRADTAAVTEVTRLYATGNAVAWQASNVVSGMVWKTSNDELVCPICGPLADTDVTFDGNLPPAHPNCRCWVVPRVKRPDELETPAATEDQPPAAPQPFEPHEFASGSAANNYLMANSSITDKDLNYFESSSLMNYQHNGYKTINGGLRTGDSELLDEHAREIELIDGVMARAQTQEDLLAHRGLLVTPGSAAEALLTSWEAGSTFREPGYMSTTVDEGRVNKFLKSLGTKTRDSTQVDIAIRVPAGTSGVYMNAAIKPEAGRTDYREERELLLARDSHYRIISKETLPNGRVRVEMEVVGQGADAAKLAKATQSEAPDTLMDKFIDVMGAVSV